MKIFAIGMNYTEHNKSLHGTLSKPERPVIFTKADSALLNNGKPFFIPDHLGRIEYETEVVVRISKLGKTIPQRFAHRYYDAVTVGIDFTARDIQNELKEKGLPWEKAKAWDNSAAVGKWIPMTDIKNRRDVNFGLYKNKEQVQQGNSGQMLFDFDYLVSYISNFFSVNIGDLIFTGTPAGVGELVVGDELEAYLGEETLLKLEVK